MKLWAVILIILSFSKLCIAGSQEKQELARDIFYQIKDNLENFQKKVILVLLIDGIIGLICGLLLLL
jgi:hypothetical protein